MDSLIERTNTKILIAEDEAIIAMDIQMRLENAGYLVVAVAASGEEAVQKTLEIHPHLVLMDIGLKGNLDGVAAACEIHRHLDTPIVYLSSYSNQSTLERAKVSEAYGYLLKPFEERTLLSTLEVALYKHRLDQELKRREEQFRMIVERSFDTLVSLDRQGNITYVSPAIERVAGYRPHEITGKSFFSLLVDADPERVNYQFSKILHGEAIEGIEDKFRCKNGETIYIESNTMPLISHGQVIGVHIIFRDITERRKTQLELQHMASHDYLTDLPNTRLFLDHLDKALARAERTSTYIAMLYIDLDGFKQVNDTYGHTTGDHLLQLVAKRLENSVRKADVVSRLGGDEFAVLMTDLQDLSSVDVIAERLHEAMQMPFGLEGTTAYIGVSIGISTFPIDAQDASQLIRYADQAMYYSKSIGKNCFSYFSEQTIRM